LGLGTKRHWHILFAIVLGATCGWLFGGPQSLPLQGVFEAVGQLFIRLIQMLVIPLVISSLVVGVTSIGDVRQLGRMGSRVFGWFMGFMLISALIGLGLGMVLNPGENLSLALQNSQSTLFALLQNASHAQVLHGEAAALTTGIPSLKELLLNMVPANPLQALVNMEMIPLVLFTLAFASALTAVGEAGRSLVAFFESVFTTTMKLTDWVFVLAVPGIFSLTFVAVAKAGPQIFQLLAPYALVMVSGLLLQAFVVFPLVLKLVANVNFLQLYKAISEAIMVAFGTASSSATLPVTIACCERRAGISNRIASFVLPTGASINKTGTTLFEVVAVLFLAQAFGIPITLGKGLLIVVFAILASIASPGVPGAGLITMSIVIHSMGKEFTPLFGGIALLWPIDRALDMLRTVVSVICSCTVATLVAAQEGELKRDVLAGHEQWEDVIKS
jgi:Na+/H+-dicarboxylate symporter